MTSNCDDMRGMFPWLLNGTLKDDEKRRVLEHLAACADCRRDLVDARLAAEIFGQHPPAEAILALAWDETPRGIDSAFLAEHLAECPRCAAELELARMSRRLEEDEKVVPFARRAAPAPATGWGGWKAAALAAGLAGVVGFAGWFQTAGRVHTLEDQLVNRAAAPAAPVPPVAVPPAAGESKQAQTLAAEVEERGRKIEQLEMQLNEVQKQATELSGQVDQLAQNRPAAPAPGTPQINAWARDLSPNADVVRSGAADPQEVPGRTYATLVLNADHPETHRDHAIEIEDASGAVVWKAAGLALDPQSKTYSLTIPPGALRAGLYTIRIYGTANGQREPVESYSIRVK